MNRVLFEAGELEQPLLRSDPRGRHILKVLNADVGDRIRIGIINGPAGTACFRELTHDYLVLEPETLNETPPALFPVTVVLGHTRPIVLQRVLRDLTTIGVGHIIVTHTELGEKSYFLSNLWQQDAYRAFLIEGAAQAGCTRLPRVDRARFLGEACELLPAPHTHPRFAFDLPLAPPDPDIDPAAPGSVAPDPDPNIDPATNLTGFVAAFGSERGWTETERRRLLDSNFSFRGLGPRILRSETAAVCGTMVLLEAAAFFA